MVNSNKAKLFPIIVNDCRLSKTIEFEFNEIDFEGMLKH